MQDALPETSGLLHWSGKGEEYQLFWPDTPNLVRLAAKANATIVPFSGIGSDECLGIVCPCDELRSAVFHGIFHQNHQVKLLRSTSRS